jgi:SAM-dependent methyltransferase
MAQRGSPMARFWDARAREDAWYFVDNRLEYRHPDLERFWRSGEADLDELLGSTGMVLRATDVVVDLGCGLGRLTRVLAARAARVVALDVSGEMVERARALNAHLGNVSWLVGNGEDLGMLEAASADALVSHVVFQHIPDPRVTLGYVREMGRVLRPGGWAAFQISDDPSIHRPPRGGLARRASELLGRTPRGQADPRWVGAAMDLRELRATGAAAGLDVERIAYAGTQHCIVGLRRR